MSARIDASGDLLRLTSNLPASTTFTASGWMFVVTDRTGVFRFASGLEGALANPSTWELIGWDDSDAFEVSANGGANTTFATNPPIGEWVYIAVQSQGTGGTDLIGYWWDAEGEAWVTAATAGRSFTPAAYVLGSNGWDEWVDGRFAHWRLWGAVLTTTELEAEMASTTAVRSTDLIADWPLATTPNDISGADNHLTEVGAITYEAQPDIGEGETGATTDGIALGDAFAGAVDLAASVADGLALGDTFAASTEQAETGATTDGVTLGDSFAAALDVPASIADGLSLGFALGYRAVLDFPDDGIALGDSFAAETEDQAARSVSEGLALGDAFHAVYDVDVQWSEGIVLGDAWTGASGQAAAIGGRVSIGPALGGHPRLSAAVGGTVTVEP